MTAQAAVRPLKACILLLYADLLNQQICRTHVLKQTGAAVRKSAGEIALVGSRRLCSARLQLQRMHPVAMTANEGRL